MGLTRAGQPRRPRCPKVIKFGSDFSGLDAAAVALKRMKVNYSMEFACDNDASSQKVLQSIHKPKKLFQNIVDRTTADETYVDVYTWTPPCQDLSSAGKQRGIKGPKQTGLLMTRSLRYIKDNLPRVTVFENVPTVATQKKFSFMINGIIKCQEKLGYKVYHAILNSKDFGIPQDRRRLFIVGIKASAMKHPFNWPQPRLPTPSVNQILDPWKPTDKAGRLPPSEGGRQRCMDAFKTCFASGRDPRAIPVLVDIDCSEKYSTFGIDEAKTITRTRGGSGGPWISTRGRRTTLNEMLKLQGFKHEDCPWDAMKISARQTGQLIGNAITVHTMGCILQEAMWSAGLIQTKPSFF